jgi:hypothetical protein
VVVVGADVAAEPDAGLPRIAPATPPPAIAAENTAAPMIFLRSMPRLLFSGSKTYEGIGQWTS